MAYRHFVVALSMILVTSPISAAQPKTTPGAGAPQAPAGAEYCLWVDPPTGSRIETIRCETRDGWAQLGVDIDEEWARWGVRVIFSKSLVT